MLSPPAVRTKPTLPLSFLPLSQVKKANGARRTVLVCKQRAGGAHGCYSVVVAGVKGPISFHPLAGNPVALLRMKKAGGACTSLPAPFLAAQCIVVGSIQSLKALRVVLRLAGTDVDVHAVCAAAAVCAHNGQAVAFPEGRENSNKCRWTSWNLSALRHTEHSAEREARSEDHMDIFCFTFRASKDLCLSQLSSCPVTKGSSNN